MSICFERIFLTNQTRISASLVITNSLILNHKQLGLSTVRMASDSKVGDNTDTNIDTEMQQEQLDVRKMKPTILRRQLTQAWNKRADTLYVKQFGPKAIPMELYPTKPKYGEIEDTDSSFHLAWESKPEHVLIVTKPGDIKITEKFKEIASFLIDIKGFKLYLESEAKRDPNLQSFSLLPLISTLKNPNIVDFVICIGGDGTFLYATSLFMRLSIPPMMCFGMGSLGFLTHFDVENFKDDIDRITNKHMSVTLRSRIAAKIIPEQRTCSIEEQIFSEDTSKSLPTDAPAFTSPKHQIRTRAVFSESGDVKIIEEIGFPQTKEFSCINEVTVDRGVSPYLTQIEIYLNDFKITTAQADGIIVATPTGSTAYSLAAGASMLHPSTEAFIITPICPHSLSFRPIVVPNGVQIKLKLAESSRHSAWVSFDGRDRQEFKLDDIILLSLDQNPVPCLNNTGHVSDWFKSLIDGLNWNVRLGQKKL